MKTVERKYYEERLETRPGEEPGELEELGLLVLTLVSLTMLGFIGLAVYAVFQ